MGPLTASGTFHRSLSPATALVSSAVNMRSCSNASQLGRVSQSSSDRWPTRVEDLRWKTPSRCKATTNRHWQNWFFTLSLSRLSKNALHMAVPGLQSTSADTEKSHGTPGIRWRGATRETRLYAYAALPKHGHFGRPRCSAPGDIAANPATETPWGLSGLGI